MQWRTWLVCQCFHSEIQSLLFDINAVDHSCEIPKSAIAGSPGLRLCLQLCSYKDCLLYSHCPLAAGFITAEAKEKANEIEREAQETYTIEKQRMIESEKKKIKAEFERKEKQVLQ